MNERRPFATFGRHEGFLDERRPFATFRKPEGFLDKRKPFENIRKTEGFINERKKFENVIFEKSVNSRAAQLHNSSSSSHSEPWTGGKERGGEE